jgi:hypothetical protein
VTLTTIDFSGRGRIKPWGKLIILFFGGKIGSSADGVGSINSVFDTMLSDADIDTECPCLYLDSGKSLSRRCRIIYRPIGWPFVPTQIKCRRLYTWQHIYERIRASDTPWARFSATQITGISRCWSIMYHAYIICWDIKYHPSFSTRILRTVLANELGCYILSHNMYQYMSEMWTL